MKPSDITIEYSDISESDVGWEDSRFFWKGKLCSYKILTGPIAKRREALALIYEDLCNCEEYLCQMTIENPRLVQSALYKSFIITYGKCFVKGKSRGMSLEESHIFSNAEEKIKDIHKSVMETRNKFVAHSDSSIMHQAEICVIYPPDGFENLQPHIVTATLEYNQPFGHSFLEQMYLVEHIKNQVIAMIERCNFNLISQRHS